MVATLTRILGVSHLSLAEDAVQDALVEALRLWPHRGVPDNPRAWIVRVARNRALDRLRRRGNWATKAAQIAHTLESLHEEDDTPQFASELRDDQLRMVFLCCHPSLGRDSQVALALKLLGGFSVAEIARAFLAGRAAVAQRLVRAKRTLRQGEVDFSIPSPDELPARLAPVLEVLYLMFNEGHGAHEGDSLVRRDLCREAIRLTLLVCDHPVIGSTEADALAALLLFQGARLATRADSDGDLILMAEQDRSQWDRAKLRQATLLLARAGRGERLSTYHLEAEIAGCHAMAPSYEETDWHRILECYDALHAINPSPVVSVNRLVAVGRLQGAAIALAAGDRAGDWSRLADYYPALVVHAELLAENGDSGRARREFSQALELAASRPVRRHIERRLAALSLP